jgi:hypothetical protein
MTNTTCPTHTLGSNVVAAIEQAWADLASRHADLPTEVVIISGSGRVTNGLIRGHYRHGGWTVEAASIPEVFISGERIHDGAKGVMTTLIHEAAHYLARVREIAETSRQGRYHNRAFVALAEELGLQAPAVADPTLGWSDCTMTDETEAAYAETLKALDAGLVASIPMDGRLYEQQAVVVVIGLMMGAYQYVMPWWLAKGSVATGIMAGRKAPAPRKARSVKITCGCRTLTVPVGEDHDDLTCSRGGAVFAPRRPGSARPSSPSYGGAGRSSTAASTSRCGAPAARSSSRCRPTLRASGTR